MADKISKRTGELQKSQAPAVSGASLKRRRDILLLFISVRSLTFATNVTATRTLPDLLTFWQQYRKSLEPNRNLALDE